MNLLELMTEYTKWFLYLQKLFEENEWSAFWLLDFQGLMFDHIEGLKDQWHLMVREFGDNHYE